MLKKAFVISLIGLQLCTNAHAWEFSNLRMQVEGCYEGKNSKGEPVRGRIEYINSQTERFDEIRVGGKKTDYLNVVFVIGDQSGEQKAIITQIFEPGTIINSQILNDQVSYKHDGSIDRVLEGNVVASLMNESLVTVKNKNSRNFEFQIYQNNNSEFIPDHYAGRTKANFQFLLVNKESCKN